MTIITREKMTQPMPKKKAVRVRKVDLERRIFQAQSHQNSDTWYLVKLQIAPDGTREGECNCYGFDRAKNCKHLKAVVGFYRGILKARKLAEELAAQGDDDAGAANGESQNATGSSTSRESAVPPEATNTADGAAGTNGELPAAATHTHHNRELAPLIKPRHKEVRMEGMSV